MRHMSILVAYGATFHVSVAIAFAPPPSLNRLTCRSQTEKSHSTRFSRIAVQFADAKDGEGESEDDRRSAYELLAVEDPEWFETFVVDTLGEELWPELQNVLEAAKAERARRIHQPIEPKAEETSSEGETGEELTISPNPKEIPKLKKEESNDDEMEGEAGERITLDPVDVSEVQDPVVQSIETPRLLGDKIEFDESANTNNIDRVDETTAKGNMDTAEKKAELGVSLSPTESLQSQSEQVLTVSTQSEVGKDVIGSEEVFVDADQAVGDTSKQAKRKDVKIEREEQPSQPAGYQDNQSEKESTTRPSQVDEAVRRISEAIGRNRFNQTSNKAESGKTEVPSESKENSEDDDPIRVNSGNFSSSTNVENDQVEEEQAGNERVIWFADPYSGEERTFPLKEMISLGYSEDQITSLRADALELILAEGIQSPRSGVPARWKSEKGSPDVKIISSQDIASTSTLSGEVPQSDRKASRGREAVNDFAESGPVRVTSPTVGGRRSSRKDGSKINPDYSRPKQEDAKGIPAPMGSERGSINNPPFAVPSEPNESDTMASRRRTAEDVKARDNVAQTQKVRDPINERQTNAPSDRDDRSGLDDKAAGRQSRSPRTNDGDAAETNTTQRQRPSPERGSKEPSRRRERTDQRVDGSRKAVYSGRSRPKKKHQVLDPPVSASSVWPDMDTFRSLLRDEAGLRLRILGDDWADTVKEESDWRLGLYRDWLWTLQNGIGEPVVESRNDRMRRKSFERMKESKKSTRSKRKKTN